MFVLGREIVPYQLPEQLTMTKRKTFSVDSLKTKVNAILTAPESKWNTEESRAALAVMLSDVLHETGNYNGFNYIPSYDAKKLGFGDRPGVWYSGDGDTYAEGAELLSSEKRFENTDSSRVYYY
jgi:hypothetical protein